MKYLLLTFLISVSFAGTEKNHQDIVNNVLKEVSCANKNPRYLVGLARGIEGLKQKSIVEVIKDDTFNVNQYRQFEKSAKLYVAKSQYGDIVIIEKEKTAYNLYAYLCVRAEVQKRYIMGFLEKEIMKKSRFCDVEDFSGSLTLEYEGKKENEFVDLNLIPLHAENTVLEKDIPTSICSPKPRTIWNYFGDYLHFKKEQTHDEEYNHFERVKK